MLPRTERNKAVLEKDYSLHTSNVMESDDGAVWWCVCDCTFNGNMETLRLYCAADGKNDVRKLDQTGTIPSSLFDKAREECRIKFSDYAQAKKS